MNLNLIRSIFKTYSPSKTFSKINEKIGKDMLEGINNMTEVINIEKR